VEQRLLRAEPDGLRGVVEHVEEVFEVIDDVDPGEALGGAGPNKRVRVAHEVKAIRMVVGQQRLQLRGLDPSPPRVLSSEAMKASLETRCSHDEPQALVRQVTEIDGDILKHAEEPRGRRMVQLPQIGRLEFIRFGQ
jgi:hypothetical protein